MGILASVEQREVVELRKKVINLFSGQELLVVGHVGVGQASFVNTVNHVINLVQPRFPYHEIAQVDGRGEDFHGSFLSRSNGPRTGMYLALKESEFSAKQKLGPIFCNIAGFSYGINFYLKQLLVSLFNSQVGNMVQMYANKEEIELLSKGRRADNNRARLLCMVSVADTFPQQFLEHVSEAQIELRSYGKSKIV